MDSKLKKTDLLTIAMPVYERTDFFDEALQSALQQTVKCEILVVDNCSSHNFFKKKCEQHGIKYYRNETNVGVFPNWNNCFKYSNTDYVSILCDDDILDRHYVEYFLNAKSKHPNLDIYYSDFELLYCNSDKRSDHKHTLPFGYMQNGTKVIEYGINYGLGFPVIASAIRKSKFSGFYTLAHGSNDWVWIYENISDFEVFGENKRLLTYRKHDSNDSGKIDTKLRCHLSIWYLYKNVLSNYLENNKSLFMSHKRYLRFFSLSYLSLIPAKELKIVLLAKNKYSETLRDELSSKSKYRIYLLLPLPIRKLTFKVLKKAKLV